MIIAVAFFLSSQSPRGTVTYETKLVLIGQKIPEHLDSYILSELVLGSHEEDIYHWYLMHITNSGLQDSTIFHFALEKMGLGTSSGYSRIV